MNKMVVNEVYLLYLDSIKNDNILFGDIPTQEVFIRNRKVYEIYKNSYNIKIRKEKIKKINERYR